MILIKFLNMSMKRVIDLLWSKQRVFSSCLLLVVFLSACASPKDVLYFQDIDKYKEEQLDEKYEAVISKDDLLAIAVSSKTPELALPFNKPVLAYQLGTTGDAGGTGIQRSLGYLVDVNGYIEFPILGKIHVEGLTRKELVVLLKTRIIEENYIKDPIITIQFLNFRISVVGEVKYSGRFNITSDRVTLLEALAMAGDLTIYGKRDRVAVIREDNGKRTILYHDLRSSELFKSSCYYLQQNDIVYVEPNKARIGQSEINQNNSVGVWLSSVSLIASIISIIINARN
jgi:Periplasmic protein involved in polysaccharide export